MVAVCEVWAEQFYSKYLLLANLLQLNGIREKQAYLYHCHGGSGKHMWFEILLTTIT